MSSILIAVIASVFVGLVSTIGDWVWASQLLRHRMWYGLAHGAGMCLAMGLALGAPAGRPMIGALGGIVAGLLAAASFYVLAPLMRGAGMGGYGAMYLSWFLLWIFIGYLDGPILRRAGRRPKRSPAASSPPSPPGSRSISSRACGPTGTRRRSTTSITSPAGRSPFSPASSRCVLWSGEMGSGVFSQFGEKRLPTPFPHTLVASMRSASRKVPGSAS